MEGPFQVINKLVAKDRIGNYGLGYTDEKGSFIVQYVGRSDTDLNGRLKQHVGHYFQFKFRYAATAKEAYAKELRNYTDFGGNETLDNDIEPAMP